MTTGVHKMFLCLVNDVSYAISNFTCIFQECTTRFVSRTMCLPVPLACVGTRSHVPTLCAPLDDKFINRIYDIRWLVRFVISYPTNNNILRNISHSRNIFKQLTLWYEDSWLTCLFSPFTDKSHKFNFLFYTLVKWWLTCTNPIEGESLVVWSSSELIKRAII